MHYERYRNETKQKTLTLSLSSSSFRMKFSSIVSRQMRGEAQSLYLWDNQNSLTSAFSCGPSWVWRRELRKLSKLQYRPIAVTFFVTHFLGIGWADETRTLCLRGYQIWHPTTLSFVELSRFKWISSSLRADTSYQPRKGRRWKYTDINVFSSPSFQRFVYFTVCNS